MELMDLSRHSERRLWVNQSNEIPKANLNLNQDPTLPEPKLKIRLGLNMGLVFGLGLGSARPIGNDVMHN